MKRLVLAVALLAACSKNIQNQEAVKQAIIEYLNAKAAQTGLDMNNIVVDVNALEFERDSARASVSFRVKGMDANASMHMNYTLERKGDRWVVRERTDANANPHGAAVPEAAPQGGMPAGHPPVSGGGGPLPPGHPQVGGAAGVGAQHGGAGAAGSKQ